MDLTRGDKLSAIDDGAIFDNGEIVAFTIKADRGKNLRVHCPLAEIGDIVQALVQLAKAAGEMRDDPKPATSQGQNYFAPIPCEGMGFQLGETPDKTLLVVRLAGFDLAFELESSGLMRLADDVVRISRTLAASGKKIQ